MRVAVVVIDMHGTTVGGTAVDVGMGRLAERTDSGTFRRAA